MELISAVVRPFKVHDVCDALQRFGFRGLTVSEVSGVAGEPGPTEIYRGAKYSTTYQPYARIEILALDGDVRDLIEVIRTVASTGRHGDGRVWTSRVPYLVRIRTGEVGTDAL
jgi:nitrogen regulatory protein P-II 1